jgi:hypothetical protein
MVMAAKEWGGSFGFAREECNRKQENAQCELNTIVGNGLFADPRRSLLFYFYSGEARDIDVELAGVDNVKLVACIAISYILVPSVALLSPVENSESGES